MSVFALPETLTLAQATAVSAALRAHIQGATGLVVVDAQALQHQDTGALAVLLDARRQAQARGLPLVLQGAGSALSALLKLYGIDSLFTEASASASAR